MWPFPKKPPRRESAPVQRPAQPMQEFEPPNLRTPVLALAWEQLEPWGIMQVLFSSDNLILRRLQIDAGTVFPIHRHEYVNELLYVADGEIKILEYTPEKTEHVRLTGDIHVFKANVWHQVIAVKPVILTVQHVPKNHMVRANIADVEEYRPKRIIGRG